MGRSKLDTGRNDAGIGQVVFHSLQGLDHKKQRVDAWDFLLLQTCRKTWEDGEHCAKT